MRRKINRVGQNTLTVSLPHKWVKENSLVPGTEVDIEILDKQRLMVDISGRDRAPSLRQATVDFNDVSPLTAKCSLDMLYNTGYDVLTLLSNSFEVREVLQNRSRQLVGFTVVEQRESECVIRDITTGLSGDIDNLMRRLFHTINSMGNEGFQALKRKDQKQLKSLILVEVSVNQLVHSCLRIIAKNGYSQTDKVVPYSVLLYYLEAIGDDLRDLYKLLGKTDLKKISDGFIDLFSQVLLFFKDFTSTFYKYDREMLDALYLRRKEFNEWSLSKFKGVDVDIAHRLLMIPTRLFDVLPILTLQIPRIES